MKANTRILTLCLLVVLSLSLAIPASARASNYFNSTGVSVTAVGNGKIQIITTVRATDIMTELGATSLVVKEKQPNGTFKTVHTYTKENLPSLVQRRQASARTELFYQGTPGKTYQVTAFFFAKNNSGSDTRVRTSSSVVA